MLWPRCSDSPEPADQLEIAAGHHHAGVGRKRLTFRTALAPARDREVDLLALDEALTRLAALSERMSRVVELRFFGGLTVEETAHVLSVSKRTVEGDWKTARAWLARELSWGGIP